MNEMDFALEKMQRLLSDAIIAWKTRGCPQSCGNEIEELTYWARRVENIFCKMVGEHDNK